MTTLILALALVSPQPKASAADDPACTPTRVTIFEEIAQPKEHRRRPLRKTVQTERWLLLLTQKNGKLQAETFSSEKGCLEFIQAKQDR